MVTVGSHGVGGGSASQARNIGPAWSKDQSTPSFRLNTAQSSDARANGPAQGSGNADDALSTQMQKAQDFDAMHGRNYNLFGAGRDKSGDVQVAQTAAGTMSDGVAAFPGEGAPDPGSNRTSVGLETAGGSDRGANGGLTKVIPKVLGKASGVVGGLVIPSNSNHDQILTIPGKPQYQITGKESEVGRTLEVQNADGSWALSAASA